MVDFEAALDEAQFFDALDAVELVKERSAEIERSTIAALSPRDPVDTKADYKQSQQKYIEVKFAINKSVRFYSCKDSFAAAMRFTVLLGNEM